MRQLSDRDLLAVIIILLVGGVTVYRADLSEGFVTVGILWGAYWLGRTHPPD